MEISFLTNDGDNTAASSTPDVGNANSNNPHPAAATSSSLSSSSSPASHLHISKKTISKLRRLSLRAKTSPAAALKMKQIKAIHAQCMMMGDFSVTARESPETALQLQRRSPAAGSSFENRSTAVTGANIIQAIENDAASLTFGGGGGTQSTDSEEGEEEEALSNDIDWCKVMEGVDASTFGYDGDFFWGDGSSGGGCGGGGESGDVREEEEGGIDEMPLCMLDEAGSELLDGIGKNYEMIISRSYPRHSSHHHFGGDDNNNDWLLGRCCEDSLWAHSVIAARKDFTFRAFTLRMMDEKDSISAACGNGMMGERRRPDLWKPLERSVLLFSGEPGYQQGAAKHCSSPCGMHRVVFDFSGNCINVNTSIFASNKLIAHWDLLSKFLVHHHHIPLSSSSTSLSSPIGLCSDEIAYLNGVTVSGGDDDALSLHIQMDASMEVVFHWLRFRYTGSLQRQQYCNDIDDDDSSNMYSRGIEELLQKNLQYFARPLLLFAIEMHDTSLVSYMNLRSCIFFNPTDPALSDCDPRAMAAVASIMGLAQLSRAWAFAANIGMVNTENHDLYMQTCDSPLYRATSATMHYISQVLLYVMYTDIPDAIRDYYTKKLEVLGKDCEQHVLILDNTTISMCHAYITASLYDMSIDTLQLMLQHFFGGMYDRDKWFAPCFYMLELWCHFNVEFLEKAAAEPGAEAVSSDEAVAIDNAYTSSSLAHSHCSSYGYVKFRLFFEYLFCKPSPGGKFIIYQGFEHNMHNCIAMMRLTKVGKVGLQAMMQGFARW